MTPKNILPFTECLVPGS